MKKAFWLMSLLGIIVLGLSVTPIQANLVQCPDIPGFCDAAQGITEGNDLINGSLGNDEIFALGGDDFVSGNMGTDFIDGGAGNDVILGGLDSDFLVGGFGNDIILPGPDTLEFYQSVSTQEGNDMVNVNASEISSCLFVQTDQGIDVLNLIGFGPYTVVKPYGIPGFGDGWIKILDPITSGRIFVRIFENDDRGTEIINGLTTPNITFLTDQQWEDEAGPTGTDPCPGQPPVGP